MPLPRIHLITLGVASIARSRAFYERLGLKASGTSNDNVTFFDVNGVVLALYGHGALAADAGLTAGEAPGFRGVTLAWNSASEAEADAVMAQALGAGARLVKPMQKAFWGGYSGYFADPDGHLWEVAYNPFFPFDEGQRLILPG